MSTLEDVFIREYKRNMRQGMANKNIYIVPLPEESKKWYVSGCELYVINSLDSDTSGLFYGLNGTIVKKLPKNTVASRRKVDLVKRDFARDENNRYIYEDVKVPAGSIVVISSKNLNLPFGYSCGNDGFGYIDFVTDGASKEFIYYIPKKYVYQTNQTALALSVKNMKNFNGMGYSTWKYGLIYLHIVPYKPNTQYVGTKILKTSLSVNYSEEVKKIVDFWVANGVVPNIAYCETESEGNLVLKETARGYDCYVPFDEVSIGDKEIYGSEESKGSGDEE